MIIFDLYGDEEILEEKDPLPPEQQKENINIFEILLERESLQVININGEIVSI